jgi:putative tricarboxylic transport membrane protein
MKEDKISALGFLGMGVTALVTMHGLSFGTIREPGTAFFPVLVSILLILLSFSLLVRSLMVRMKGTSQLWSDRWIKLIPSVAVLVSYAFLLKPLGYVVCTIPTLIFFAKLERCSWKTTLLISFLCTSLSYIVFRWYLQSPLPKGIIPF